MELRSRGARPAGAGRPPKVLPAGGRRPRSRPGGWGDSLGGCGAPGDEPARRRPVRGARPVLGGAGARYDRPAGDAGARRWGRWTPAARKRTAPVPRAAGRRSPATLPHPALRTPAPYRRRCAPVLRRSASAGGGMRSVGGTCVREATTAVGRNGSRSARREAPTCGFRSTPRRTRVRVAIDLAGSLCGAPGKGRWAPAKGPVGARKGPAGAWGGADEAAGTADGAPGKAPAGARRAAGVRPGVLSASRARTRCPSWSGPSPARRR